LNIASARASPAGIGEALKALAASAYLRALAAAIARRAWSGELALLEKLLNALV